MRCSIGAATPATVRPERRSIRCSTPHLKNPLVLIPRVLCCRQMAPSTVRSTDTSSALSHPRRLSAVAARRLGPSAVHGQPAGRRRLALALPAVHHDRAQPHDRQLQLAGGCGEHSRHGAFREHLRDWSCSALLQDNDDGSGYFHTKENVLVYGRYGQKADMAGHDNWHVGVSLCGLAILLLPAFAALNACQGLL